MKYFGKGMDKTFVSSYACEQLSETPNERLMHYYYPGAYTGGGRDGILAMVRPERGAPWLGTFAFGRIAPKGVSGMFAMPNPQQLCVVAKGEGYIVSANAPTEWELVRAIPIIDVRPVRAAGLIIFADFTKLIAYGYEGFKWQTEQLSWDDLRITEVTDTYISGEFWDIRSESIASFAVDLATGSHRGGVKLI
jgi:hypothetical protein